MENGMNLKKCAFELMSFPLQSKRLTQAKGIWDMPLNAAGKFSKRVSQTFKTKTKLFPTLTPYGHCFKQAFLRSLSSSKRKHFHSHILRELLDIFNFHNKLKYVVIDTDYTLIFDICSYYQALVFAFYGIWKAIFEK